MCTDSYVCGTLACFRRWYRRRRKSPRPANAIRNKIPKLIPIPTFAPVVRLLEVVGTVEGGGVSEGPPDGVPEGVPEGASGGASKMLVGEGVGDGSCTH